MSVNTVLRDFDLIMNLYSMYLSFILEFIQCILVNNSTQVFGNFFIFLCTSLGLFSFLYAREYIFENLEEFLLD